MSTALRRRDDTFCEANWTCSTWNERNETGREWWNRVEWHFLRTGRRLSQIRLEVVPRVLHRLHLDTALFTHIPRYSRVTILFTFRLRACANLSPFARDLHAELERYAGIPRPCALSFPMSRERDSFEPLRLPVQRENWRIEHEKNRARKILRWKFLFFVHHSSVLIWNSSELSARRIIEEREKGRKIISLFRRLKWQFLRASSNEINCSIINSILLFVLTFALLRIEICPTICKTRTIYTAFEPNHVTRWVVRKAGKAIPRND